MDFRHAFSTALLCTVTLAGLAGCERKPTDPPLPKGDATPESPKPVTPPAPPSSGVPPMR